MTLRVTSTTSRYEHTITVITRLPNRLRFSHAGSIVSLASVMLRQPRIHCRPAEGHCRQTEDDGSLMVADVSLALSPPLKATPSSLSWTLTKLFKSQCLFSTSSFELCYGPSFHLHFIFLPHFKPFSTGCRVGQYFLSPTQDVFSPSRSLLQLKDCLPALEVLVEN